MLRTRERRVKMKSLIKPITIVSSLPCIEVKMTLKELCGSSLYDYPFRGEVTNNSFCFIKNTPLFSAVDNGIDPIIVGEFFQKDGKTHITISPKLSTFSLISFVLLSVLPFVIGITTFLSIASVSISDAVIMAVPVTWVLSVFPFLVYLSCLIKFRRAVKKIKEAITE